MEKFKAWLFGVWNKEVEAWRGLQEALSADKNKVPVLSSSGEPTIITNTEVWLRRFITPVVVTFVGIFLIWSFFKEQARPKKKYSHHGVNRYGERY